MEDDILRKGDFVIIKKGIYKGQRGKVVKVIKGLILVTVNGRESEFKRNQLDKEKKKDRIKKFALSCGPQ